jgi:hypothetical protein
MIYTGYLSLVIPKILRLKVFSSDSLRIICIPNHYYSLLSTVLLLAISTRYLKPPGQSCLSYLSRPHFPLPNLAIPYLV